MVEYIIVDIKMTPFTVLIALLHYYEPGSTYSFSSIVLYPYKTEKTFMRSGPELGKGWRMQNLGGRKEIFSAQVKNIFDLNSVQKMI